MSEGIKWGPAIAVDGKRPGWLERHTPLRWYGEGVDQAWWDRGKGDYFTTAEQLWWADHITAIALPADHPHYRQTEAAPIDWSGELEAVHEDGRVVAVKLRHDDGGSRLPMRIDQTLEDGIEDSIEWFERDGSCNVGGWRIRNVLQPTPQADTKPDVTAGEDFVAMVARLSHSGDDGFVPSDIDDASGALDGLIAKARTIMTRNSVTLPMMTEEDARSLWYRSDDGSEPVMTANIAVVMLKSLGLILPEPVDPDLIEARKLAAVWSESQDVSYSHYLDGHMDDSAEVRGMVAALARGRELALAGEKEA